MRATLPDDAPDAADAPVALFGAWAILAVATFAGFPAGNLLLALNARRLGKRIAAPLLFTAAAIGLLAGAALAALIGAFSGIVVYQIRFAFIALNFVPINLLAGLLLTLCAHLGETQAIKGGMRVTRRSGRDAAGLGALTFLTTLVVGTLAAVARVALA